MKITLVNCPYCNLNQKIFHISYNLKKFLNNFEKFKNAAFTAPPTIKNGSGEWLIAPLIETTHPLFLDRVGQNALDNGCHPLR